MKIIFLLLNINKIDVIKKKQNRIGLGLESTLVSGSVWIILNQHRIREPVVMMDPCDQFPIRVVCVCFVSSATSSLLSLSHTSLFLLTGTSSPLVTGKFIRS